MLQSVVRRMKIKACKLVIGKHTLRTAARFAAGRAGVVAFNRALDLMTSLMGSPKESDKLLKRIRDVVVEFFVLFSENEFEMETLSSMGDRLGSICDRFSDDFPELPEEGMIIEDEGHDAICIVAKPMVEDLITEFSTILIETLGASFESATIRKIHAVVNQLKEPHVLEQICRFDSSTHCILLDLEDKVDRIDPDYTEGAVLSQIEPNSDSDPFGAVRRILGKDSFI